MIIEKVLSKIVYSQNKSNIPLINIGDIINIKILIKEGNKERLQQCEGVVISKKNGNLVTIRRIFKYWDRIRFSTVTPHVVSLSIKRNSKDRRSKLFYLRVEL